jgi:hypothetical protein
VSSTITGDARVVAGELLTRVRARYGVASSVRQVPEVVAALGRSRSDPFEDESTPGLLDPRALCGRLTALFVGDSGIMMTLGDLDIAIREHVTMLVVVMNDQALGSEITLLGGAGLDVRDAYLRTPDLAAVARAMGAEGLRIESLDQLDALPDRLARLRGPLLLDCRVMRDGVGI